jgi:hypothetical protein
MKAVDLTKYPIVSQIQTAKVNPKIRKAMANARSLDSLISTIKNNVIISETALEYFVQKYNH